MTDYNETNTGKPYQVYYWKEVLTLLGVEGGIGFAIAQARSKNEAISLIGIAYQKRGLHAYAQELQAELSNKEPQVFEDDFAIVSNGR